jgi:hypothetical protein
MRLFIVSVFALLFNFHDVFGGIPLEEQRSSLLYMDHDLYPVGESFQYQRPPHTWIPGKIPTSKAFLFTNLFRATTRNAADAQFHAYFNRTVTEFSNSACRVALKLTIMETKSRLVRLEVSDEGESEDCLRNGPSRNALLDSLSENVDRKARRELTGILHSSEDSSDFFYFGGVLESPSDPFDRKYFTYSKGSQRIQVRTSDPNLAETLNRLIESAKEKKLIVSLGLNYSGAAKDPQIRFVIPLLTGSEILRPQSP